MPSTDEATKDTDEIRSLIARWAEAVRAHDLRGVSADHGADMLLFDVPPPTELRGIDAYEKSWPQLFSWFGSRQAFEVGDIVVHAGGDVAFATAVVRCSGEENGKPVDIDVRLTVGLERRGGRWTVVHEHHSIPATS